MTYVHHGGFVLLIYNSLALYRASYNLFKFKIVRMFEVRMKLASSLADEHHTRPGWYGNFGHSNAFLLINLE